MVKTQIRRINSVKRISSDELKQLSNEDIVFVPRSTITAEIVKLQNSRSNTKEIVNPLKILIDSFCNQNKENFSKSKLVQMDVKSVNLCFQGKPIFLYIDD